MVAEFLIRFGARLTHRDNKGFGPLERAYMAGRKPLIDYLMLTAVITSDQVGRKPNGDQPGIGCFVRFDLTITTASLCQTLHTRFALVAGWVYTSESRRLLA